MTIEPFLEALCAEDAEAVAELRLMPRPQKGDLDYPAEGVPPTVYPMRLPDSSAAKKVAPYIINRIVTTKSFQPRGEKPRTVATVRSIFCVYDQDEEAGSLALLELMERVRIHRLRRVTLAGQYQLDREAGTETLVYEEDTVPYYAGEMVSTWIIPQIEREANLW